MAAHDITTKSKLQTSLNGFSALTRQLMETVSGDGRPSAEQTQVVRGVVDKLIERDKEIQQLTETALEMKSRQIEVNKVSEELKKRTQEIRELQLRLQEAEKILEQAVFHGHQKMESVERAKNGAISPETLIRYAHRISQASSTISPVGWQPNDPRRPFPQDIEMRSGFLGQLTSGILPPQLPAGGSTTGVEEGNPPPEKRIALNAIPSRVFSGMNQNNNNRPPLGGGNFEQTFSISTKYDEPETMSEDTSSSSSDEGPA